MVLNINTCHISINIGSWQNLTLFWKSSLAWKAEVWRPLVSIRWTTLDWCKAEELTKVQPATASAVCMDV